MDVFVEFGMMKHSVKKEGRKIRRVSSSILITQG